jgi:hypothetical protein
VGTLLEEAKALEDSSSQRYRIPRHLGMFSYARPQHHLAQESTVCVVNDLLL